MAEAQFPEMVKIEPCSFNQCANGHKWPVQLALQQCPGCGAMMLLVRMVNCPSCNEPTLRMQLRSDHCTPQMGIPALCRQQRGQGVSTMIVMERTAHEDVEKRWDPATGRVDFEKKVD